MSYDMGRYRVRVVSQEFGKAGKNETPFLALEVQPLVYFGINSEVPCGDLPTRKLYWYLTDKTIDFSVRDLRALGFEGDSFAEIATGSHSFSGVEFEAGMKFETYEGKTREKWTALLSTPDQLGDDDISKLDKLFGKALKASKPVAKPAKSTVRKESEIVYAAADNGKDNIHF